MYEEKLLMTTLSTEFPHNFVIVNKSHEKKKANTKTLLDLSKLSKNSSAVTAGRCKQRIHYFVFSALATM